MEARHSVSRVEAFPHNTILDLATRLALREPNQVATRQKRAAAAVRADASRRRAFNSSDAGCVGSRAPHGAKADCARVKGEEARQDCPLKAVPDPQERLKAIHEAATLKPLMLLLLDLARR